MSFFTKNYEMLVEAPNFIVFPDGTELFANDKDKYTYPVQGWYWFDTTIEAKQFFGIPLDGNDIIMDQGSANRF